MKPENNDEVKTETMTAQELIKRTGRSKTTIYNLAAKLGRLPTVEEVLNRKPGRPRKNWQ